MPSGGRSPARGGGQNKMKWADSQLKLRKRVCVGIGSRYESTAARTKLQAHLQPNRTKKKSPLWRCHAEYECGPAGTHYQAGPVAATAANQRPSQPNEAYHVGANLAKPLRAVVIPIRIPRARARNVFFQVGSLRPSSL